MFSILNSNMFQNSIKKFVWFIYDSLSNNVCDSAFFLLVGITFFFGLLCKRVENVKYKKWMASGFGILSILILGGISLLWHMLTIGIICSLVIVYTGKRKCHIAAFVVMFTYLGVYRLIAILYPDNTSVNMAMYISLAQMMLTCKFVGVGFEIRNSFEEKQKTIKNGKKISIDDEGVINPSLTEILHYGFSYFGSHAGPYVRYRTYHDYLNLPFSKAVGIKGALKKFAWSLVLGIIYLIINDNWPLEYTLTNEFRDCSVPYKALFSFIHLESFFFWLTCGLTMSEAACAAAGLGAYPVEGVNKTGHGPTVGYAKLRKISYKKAEKLEYDFNTLTSMDIVGVQTSPWMSVQTRSWNRSFQYFMATYIFGTILDIPASRDFRIFVTIFASAFWHGLDPGNYMGMFTVPLYMLTERLYRTMYRLLTGWKAKLLLGCMFAAKIFILSYASVVFKLLYFDNILIYLVSIQYLPYIFHICIHILGLAIVTSLKKSKIID